MSVNQRSNSLALWWQRFTEPAAAIHSPEDRRRARLLAALHVVLTPPYIIYLLARNQTPAPVPYVEVAIGGLIVAYGLSRSKYYQFAAGLSVVIVSAIPFLSILITSDGPKAPLFLTLTWVAWAVLLGYILLPLRATALVIAANLSGVMLLPFLIPGISFLAIGPSLGFIISVSLLVLVATVIRRHDLQQIEQTEKALRESEERFRATFEQAAVGIAQTSPDGRWLRLNQKLCEMVGYTHDELLARTWQDITHPEDLDSDLALAQQLLAGEIETYSMEKRYIRKDGSLIWVNITVSLVCTLSGEPDYHVVVVENITERKRAEAQQLELALEKERVQMLQHFIRDTSHDLRTPLTTIKTSLYLLERTMEDPLKRKRYMTAIDEQATRLHQLLEDLLSTSRLDKSSTEEFTFEMRSLNLLLQNVVAGQKALAERKRHALTVKVDADIPPILIDDTQLYRALSNILINALNCTPDGGQIEVRAYRRDERTAVEVQDNGTGISEDDLPRIFDRFFRADRARGGETGGGLGLTIAKRIIEAHGGDIEVESKVGEGSIFRVWLPVVNNTAL